ncbi:MAG: redoxin domain-containing protein [Thiotrichales bacterium]
MSPNAYPRLRILALLVAVVGALTALGTQTAQATDNLGPAPEFTHADPGDWFNSAPLKLADLRGKVVLLDVWTFGCWNCYRSFPWLKALESSLAGQAFVVVGVHTPEFDHEREEHDAVAAKNREFGLKHPVMLDNDSSDWRALNNRYWPAFYLIDKRGNRRARFVGEAHEGDRNAHAIEVAVDGLLSELRR